MPLPKGLPWGGDSSRGLHQQRFGNLKKYGKLKTPRPSTSPSHPTACGPPTAQRTNPPKSWPYTEVSRCLRDEGQVMFSKDMKKQSKTQCHPVKQRLQSGIQKLIACPQNQRVLGQYRVHTGVKGDSPAESEGLF